MTKHSVERSSVVLASVLAVAAIADGCREPELAMAVGPDVVMEPTESGCARPAATDPGAVVIPSGEAFEVLGESYGKDYLCLHARWHGQGGYVLQTHRIQRDPPKSHGGC